MLILVKSPSHSLSKPKLYICLGLTIVASQQAQGIDPVLGNNIGLESQIVVQGQSNNEPMFRVRGFVKLKKFKNPRKTRIGRTPPTHLPYPIFYFFWQQLQQQKTTQKHKKTQHFQKKKSSWGLTHPPTYEFFSDFCIFFNLTKPLSRDAVFVFSIPILLVFNSGPSRLTGASSINKMMLPVDKFRITCEKN